MTTMEIDPPEGDGTALTVNVHPLALIHMSDQFTRIRCGGSPLDAASPVEGILFGQAETTSSNNTTTNNNNNSPDTTISIPDAGDIPLHDAQPQIDLHRAVFPRQFPVGWYKVVVTTNNNNNNNNTDEEEDAAEPTLADLQQTIHVANTYVQKESTTATTTGTPPTTLLGILQVPSPTNSSNNDQKQPSSTKNTNNDDDDDEDELPLTLYQLSPDHNSLMALPQGAWQLTTATSERIAVQRVMREKAITSTGDNDHEAPTAGGSTAATSNSSTDPWVSLRDSHAWQVSRQSATLGPHMQDLHESCQAIDNRLTKLLVFLQDTMQSASSDGTPPPPHVFVLLRQIQGLLLQKMGPIAATCPRPQMRQQNNNSTAPPQLLQQIAQLAQAVDAATLYAEKCKFLHEHGGGSGGQRPLVRRF